MSQPNASAQVNSKQGLYPASRDPNERPTLQPKGKLTSPKSSLLGRILASFESKTEDGIRVAGLQPHWLIPSLGLSSSALVQAWVWWGLSLYSYQAYVLGGDREAENGGPWTTDTFLSVGDSPFESRVCSFTPYPGFNFLKTTLFPLLKI